MAATPRTSKNPRKTRDRMLMSRRFVWRHQDWSDHEQQHRSQQPATDPGARRPLVVSISSTSLRKAEGPDLPHELRIAAAVALA